MGNEEEIGQSHVHHFTKSLLKKREKKTEERVVA